MAKQSFKWFLADFRKGYRRVTLNSDMFGQRSSAKLSGSISEPLRENKAGLILNMLTNPSLSSKAQVFLLISKMFWTVLTIYNAHSPNCSAQPGQPFPSRNCEATCNTKLNFDLTLEMIPS